MTIERVQRLASDVLDVFYHGLPLSLQPLRFPLVVRPVCGLIHDVKAVSCL